MTKTAPSTALRLMIAADLAARHHVSQRRKGAGAEPYINHPIEVACLIVTATEGAAGEAAVAALLHDTVEDTDLTLAEIADAFGAATAAIVAEVSDDKRLPKDERKRLQIEHAPSLSPDARLVKIADKVSNLRALRTSPPLNWSIDRRRTYFEWAKAVVDQIRGTEPTLEAWFDREYVDGLAELARLQPFS